MIKLQHTATSGLALLALLPAGVLAQQELNKFVASDVAPFDRFGGSVVIFDGRVASGSQLHDEFAADSGSVYVHDAASGLELFELHASDAQQGDHFGTSIAMDGVHILVGAELDDDNGNDSGSAYVFDATTGAQLFKLKASDGAADDIFGFSVALSGDRAIIGAPGVDGQGLDAGAVYVFDLTTGLELYKWNAASAVALDRVGYSVAAEGDVVVAGAPSDPGLDAGAVFLFDLASGGQLHELQATDGAAGDFLGVSVDVSAGVVIAGANRDSQNGSDSGSAYLFDAGTGAELFKLLASDGAESDRFGHSVSISGQRAIVGALGDDDLGDGSGSAYVYHTATGLELYKLNASDGFATDGFGFVSIDDDRALVGAPQEGGVGIYSGAAYLFAIELSLGTPYCFGDTGLANCPCGNYAGVDEGCANSGAAGAELSASGSSVVAADDLEFSCSQLLPSQPSLLFAGHNAVAGGGGVLFGDGIRCAGGSVARLGVRVPSILGDSAWGPGLGASGGWSGGDTRRFQVWYRDPLGPCGSGFNLSNGVEVQFTP